MRPERQARFCRESGTERAPLFFVCQHIQYHSLRENQSVKPREFEGRALKNYRLLLVLRNTHELSHGFLVSQSHSVGIVRNAVTNGICQQRVGDFVEPTGYRRLSVTPDFCSSRYTHSQSGMAYTTSGVRPG